MGVRVRERGHVDERSGVWSAGFLVGQAISFRGLDGEAGRLLLKRACDARAVCLQEPAWRHPRMCPHGKPLTCRLTLIQLAGK
jgi:hypothetical protein